MCWLKTVYMMHLQGDDGVPGLFGTPGTSGLPGSKGELFFTNKCISP